MAKNFIPVFQPSASCSLFKFRYPSHFQPLYHLILSSLFVIVSFSNFLIYRFAVQVKLCLFLESTKYYLFGNAFLPEAIAVYPRFLYGLTWKS
jgi:hypothetical protein